VFAVEIRTEFFLCFSGVNLICTRVLMKRGICVACSRRFGICVSTVTRWVQRVFADIK